MHVAVQLGFFLCLHISTGPVTDEGMMMLQNNRGENSQ